MLDRSTDRPTKVAIDRFQSASIDRSIDRLTDRPMDRWTDRPIDRSIDSSHAQRRRSIDWAADRLTDQDTGPTLLAPSRRARVGEREKDEPVAVTWVGRSCELGAWPESIAPHSVVPCSPFCVYRSLFCVSRPPFSSLPFGLSAVPALSSHRPTGRRERWFGQQLLRMKIGRFVGSPIDRPSD